VSRRDGGSASVLVLGLCAVVLLAGTTASALGAVAVARHRAAAAADAGALAAAARVAEGQAAACTAAARVVAAGGAALRHCVVEGWDAVVTVELRPPGPVGRLGAATGRARAGP
jgi:secretion/DNA translocation related TadE-like protein